MSWRSKAYKFLKYSNDFNAINKGKVTKRLARRGLGFAFGNLIRKIVGN